MKLVYGVGINDSLEAVSSQKTGWRCPYYQKWSLMMQRGYSEKYKQKQPTYAFVTVHHEWHYFSEFKEWMRSQPHGEGLELDKDILSPGNLIYSSDKCALVPHYLNSVILDSSANRGGLPIGVSLVSCRGGHGLSAKPFQARVRDGSRKQIHIGVFESAEKAHLAWRLAKAKQVDLARERYQVEPFSRTDVIEALMLRSKILRDLQ